MYSSGRVNLLDTETTGFSPAQGDRIVEIGIVEMVDGELTGREFHEYLNPEGQPVGQSYNVHGLSDQFLADKPSFSEIYQSFLSFIGNDPLVIHNAPFDMRFLRAEIELVYGEYLSNEIIDTLEIARRCNHGGRDDKLDTLCQVFDVDISDRKFHGALKDAHLLAAVYNNLLRIC